MPEDFSADYDETAQGKSTEKLEFADILFRQVMSILYTSSTIYSQEQLSIGLKNLRIRIDFLSRLLARYHDNRYLKTKKIIETELLKLNPKQDGDEDKYIFYLEKKVESLMLLMGRHDLLPPVRVRAELRVPWKYLKS